MKEITASNFKLAEFCSNQYIKNLCYSVKELKYNRNLCTE